MAKDLTDIRITDEQAAQVRLWLEANDEVMSPYHSLPLGLVQIDPRASGATKRRVEGYVQVDAETARMVPELRGLYRKSIDAFMARREGKDPERTGETSRPAGRVYLFSFGCHSNCEAQSLVIIENGTDPRRAFTALVVNEFIPGHEARVSARGLPIESDGEVLYGERHAVQARLEPADEAMIAHWAGLPYIKGPLPLRSLLDSGALKVLAEEQARYIDAALDEPAANQDPEP